MKGGVASSLTGPTPFLPFFSCDEEAALAPHGLQRRIAGVATPKAFLSLLNSGPFAEAMHPRGDWKPEPWMIDGKVMYRGQVRSARLSDFVRDHTSGGDFLVETADSNRSESRVNIEEEQHFYREKTRGKGSSAILEVRRYVLDLFDDGCPPLCVVAQWSLNFDGFNASARLHCGSAAREFDLNLKTAYINAYVLYFDVWMRMANRLYARIVLPTLNSTLNKKISDNGVSSDSGGGGVVSGAHHIFVPRGMANVSIGNNCQSLGVEVLLVKKGNEQELERTIEAETLEDQLGLVDAPGGLPVQHWQKALDRLSRWTAAAKSQCDDIGCEEGHNIGQPHWGIPLVDGTKDGNEATETIWVNSHVNLATEIVLQEQEAAAPKESKSKLDMTLPSEDQQGRRKGSSSRTTFMPENSQSTRYTVYIHTPQLGIQIRELHGIPVIAGLKGFGVTDNEAEEDEREQSQEAFQWEPIQCLNEENPKDVSQSFSASLSAFGDDSSCFQSRLGGNLQGSSSQQMEHCSVFALTNDWYSIDLEIKMVLECPSVFGKGIRKLWRWKPSCDREELGSKTGLVQFVLGLLKRLGPRARTHFVQEQLDDAVSLLASELHVSFFDREEGDYISLDAESWPEFIYLNHKRLMVSLALEGGDTVLSKRDSVVELASAPNTIIEEKNSNDNATEYDDGRLQDSNTGEASADGGINGEFQDERDEGLLFSVGDDDIATTTESVLQETANGKVVVVEPNSISDEWKLGGKSSGEINNDISGTLVAETCEVRSADANSSGPAAAFPEGGFDCPPQIIHCPSDGSISHQMMVLQKRLGAITSPLGDKHDEIPGPSISTYFVATKVAPAEGSDKEELLVGCMDVEERENDTLPVLQNDENADPLVSMPNAVAKADIFETSAATVSSASPYAGIDSCAKHVERRPCIGAVLVSVNGVRIQGLSFRNAVELLQQRQRPISIELEDSWDRIFHRHIIEVEAREKISRETFNQKLAHPLASKLRKQISEWVKAFRDQDLGEVCSRFDADSKDPKAPQVMTLSLIRYVEAQLRDLGVFSNDHIAGGGLPVMGELQWEDVSHHVEAHVFEHIFDVCLMAAPDYRDGDAAVSQRVASLRFLQPHHWCVDFLPQNSSQRGYGREWELAQHELCRIVEYRCPRDMIDCVRACVRLVALCVEASMARRGQSANFGADDLLAALTWVVVQANPPRLTSRMWFMLYYLRTDDACGIGEGGYCLTQLASAVEFAKECDASMLADITDVEFSRGLEVNSLTQAFIDASAEGNIVTMRQLIKCGADINGLSTDQQNTALTFAICNKHVKTVKFLLKLPNIAPNRRICPNYVLHHYNNFHCHETPLMIAARLGYMECVILLVGHPFTDRTLVCAEGLTALDHAKSQQQCEKLLAVLAADPQNVNLVQATAAGKSLFVEALLLQGEDPNVLDSQGKFSPLMIATLKGDFAIVQALLKHPPINVNYCNTDGESPLMYCVQRDGYATPDSQVEAAVELLVKGADRSTLDHQGRTALDWAERFGSVRLADVLRYSPDEVKIYDLAKARNARGVFALLQHGVDPNQRSPSHGFTALEAAIFNQDEDVVRVLTSSPAVTSTALSSHHHDKRSVADVNLPGARCMTPLMHAIQICREQMILLLLSRGADRYACTPSGQTAISLARTRKMQGVADILEHDPKRSSICVAAATCGWGQVKALHKQGVSLNSQHYIRTRDGWHHDSFTPLIACCSHGHVHLMQWLLGAGADVNVRNVIGQSPLMHASLQGEEELILSLLKAGANRYFTDMQGRNAVWWAGQSRALNRDTLVPLIRNDPSVGSIAVAAAAGHIEDVIALVRQGINPEEKAPVELGTLFAALCVQDVSDIAVKQNLFRSTFDPSVLHLTPLAVAAIFGRDKVVKELLQSENLSVDVNGRDGLRRTPLMYACRFGNLSTALLLLQEGARRYCRDYQGMTATSHAIMSGDVSIAALINADPDRITLQQVSGEGKLLLMLGLLKQGADVNESAPGGGRICSPLMAATASKQQQAVEILLERPELDIDARNSRGETALMLGARAGALGICRALIMAGANPDAHDLKGLTAEHHAYKLGHKNMILYKTILALAYPWRKKTKRAKLKKAEALQA